MRPFSLAAHPDRLSCGVLRLIVNADDLGLTRGVNRAIVQSHQQGIVTSATLMANAPAFSDAVALLQTVPTLSVGCHLVLVDGTPLAPSNSIPSLLDPDASAPSFRKKLWKFALAAARGKISSREVEAEASAQIQKLLQAGVPISHVDCHKHAHMFPAVLEGVLRAANAHGIRAIRNPFEPAFARPAAVKLGAKNAIRSAESALLSRQYSRMFRVRVSRYGLTTTDGSIGVTVTGSLDLQRFTESLRNAPAVGTYEFVCHPGYNDVELANAGTRLVQSRETELTLLCSPEARKLVANAELIQFSNLASAPESNLPASHPMP